MAHPRIRARPRAAVQQRCSTTVSIGATAPRCRRFRALQRAQRGTSHSSQLCASVSSRRPLTAAFRIEALAVVKRDSHATPRPRPEATAEQSTTSGELVSAQGEAPPRAGPTSRSGRYGAALQSGRVRERRGSRVPRVARGGTARSVWTEQGYATSTATADRRHADALRYPGFRRIRTGSGSSSRRGIRGDRRSPRTRDARAIVPLVEVERTTRNDACAIVGPEPCSTWPSGGSPTRHRPAAALELATSTAAAGHWLIASATAGTGAHLRVGLVAMPPLRQ